MAAILRVIYIALFIMVFLYIFFKKRKIDFIAIYFISSVLYFFPLLLGQFQAFVFGTNGFTYTPQKIDEKAYIVLISNSLICLIWILFKDFYRKKDDIAKKRICFVLNDYQSIIVIGTELLFLIINIYLSYRLREFIFAKVFDKTVLLQNTTILDMIALNITYFLFIVVFSFKLKWKKTAKILSMFLLIYPLLLAKRSEIVMGVIAIGFIWVAQQEYDSIWNLVKQKKWLVIGATLFIVVVFMSKAILNYAVQGNWDIVFQYLTQKGTLRESFIYSEPNVITSNLNEILRLRVQADGDSYRFSLLGFIPFIGSISDGFLVPREFYQIYQPIVYPKLSEWGTANCFLAEAVSNGGWLTLICVINGLCGVMMLMERYLYKGKNMILKGGVLSAAPYLIFYIHRNTLYFTIRSVRFFFYLAVLLNIVYVLIAKRK